MCEFFFNNPRLLSDLTKCDVEELNHVSSQIRNQEHPPGVWVHVDLVQVWPPLSVGQVFPSVRIICVHITTSRVTVHLGCILQTAVSIHLKGRYLAVPITDGYKVRSGHVPRDVTRGSTVDTFPVCDSYTSIGPVKMINEIFDPREEQQDSTYVSSFPTRTSLPSLVITSVVI